MENLPLATKAPNLINDSLFIAIGVLLTRFSPLVFGILNGKTKADKDLKNTLVEHISRLERIDKEQGAQITELERQNAKKEAKLEILTDLLSGKIPDLDQIIDEMHQKINESSGVEANSDDDFTAEISQVQDTTESIDGTQDMNKNPFTE